MRNLNLPPFHKWRTTGPEIIALYGSNGGPREGAFFLPSGTRFDTYRSNTGLAVIAVADEGWDHVSVSGKNRTPNWGEMMLVYRIFFNPGEIAVQYCLPSDKHVNIHPNVLHLWRQWDVEVQLPPVEFV